MNILRAGPRLLACGNRRRQFTLNHLQPEAAGSRSGIAALFLVVVISAVGLLIAVTNVWLGLGDLDQGYVSQKGAEARVLADGCAEEVLRRIKLDSSYGVGSGTIDLGLSNGNCNISVIDPNAPSSQRVINVAGNVEIYSKSLVIQLTVENGNITVDSWGEG